jgi:hypothetical protein
MSKRKKKKSPYESSSPVADDLAGKLRRATQSLYYVSETDAEIAPFIGQKATVVTKEEILRQTGKSADENVEERDFSQTFEKLTKVQDWFGAEETETTKKFVFLRDLLTENLKDLKVFKIGKIELDVYIVGLDDQSILCGVQTKAVET